jgi:hypothetical protein
MLTADGGRPLRAAACSSISVIRERTEPVKRTWNWKFLDLAGPGPDFLYPDEPPPAEPGP